MVEKEPGVKKVRMEVGEDGALLPANAELLAIAMAEGKDAANAWREIGKDNTGYSGVERRGYEVDPIFLRRLDDLKLQRSHLLKDPVFGMASWMADLIFRTARASKDMKSMIAAAQMRQQIALKAYVPPKEPDAGEEGGKEKRPVGRPVAENPQSRVDRAGIKNRLMARGVSTDGLADDE